MTKIAISGYYGFDNFGDEAILFTLLQNLKKNFHEITVFSKNPSATAEKYNVSSVQTFSIFQILKTLKTADVLISGGGSLLQDATSTKSLVYYLCVIMIAQFFKKKTIIFAQGIGPIHNNFLRILTQKVLEKVSYLSVRDEKSLFLLRGWGLKPTLVNDPVWGVSLSGTEKQNIIGIQLRSWATLSEEFLFELAKLVGETYPTKKIRLLAFQNMLDLPVCEKFKKYLLLVNTKLDIEIVENNSMSQMIKALTECDLLVAMRYHALLLGLKAGIKSFALCYDVKVQTLAEENKIPYVHVNDTDNLISNFYKLQIQEIPNPQKEFSFDEINGLLQ